MSDGGMSSGGRKIISPRPVTVVAVVRLEYPRSKASPSPFPSLTYHISNITKKKTKPHFKYSLLLLYSTSSLFLLPSGLPTYSDTQRPQRHDQDKGEPELISRYNVDRQYE